MPLPQAMDENEKETIIRSRCHILQKVKKFIDEFLNPHKSSFRGNTITISEILIELEISE